jgi:hypothetical protein
MSEMIEHVAGLATALSTAETSANQAMIDMLAVGTAMFRARQSVVFHNLECQRGVELFGSGVAKMTEGIGDLARAHREVVQTGIKHKVLDSGALCPSPEPGTPHGSNVQPIKVDKAA